MKVSFFTITAFIVTFSAIAIGEGVSARSVKHPRVSHADLTKKNQIQSLYIPPASKRAQVILCPADLHRCDDGTECILQSWLCDGGKPDCDDGSDERDCDTTLCYPGRFKCSNTGKCVTSVFRCDGKDDCGDASDEAGCPPVTCPPDRFKCQESSRFCIPISFVCDGDHDCPNSSDEFNCSITECRSGQVLCNDSSRCISENWICDSDNDCPDRSDEQDCETRPCPTARPMKCPSTGICYPEYFKCDGFRHCSDGYDEENCPLLPLETTVGPELHTQDTGTLHSVGHFSTPEPDLEVDTEDQQQTNNEASDDSSDDDDENSGCDEKKNDSTEKEALEEILDVLHHTNGRDISASTGRKHRRRANHATGKKNH